MEREFKTICGPLFNRYLFSVVYIRSYLLVNYVYCLVSLCFGIFSVLFIRIRPSGLLTPTNPQPDIILLFCISQLIGKIVCFCFVRLLLNIDCFFTLGSL